MSEDSTVPSNQSPTRTLSWRAKASSEILALGIGPPLPHGSSNADLPPNFLPPQATGAGKGNDHRVVSSLKIFYRLTELAPTKFVHLCGNHKERPVIVLQPLKHLHIQGRG